MFFKKRKQNKLQVHNQYAVSSNYGRAMTSIQSAHDELYLDTIDFNPLEFLKEGKNFLGFEHFSKDSLYNHESIHTQIVAPTRSGKGVYLGVKAVEALREKRGLIIVDPKEDDFLPQVILEELERQNCSEDLHIISWPNDFGYSVFSEYDTIAEATKKLVVMLELIEKEDEAGASYYRKSERIVLAQVIKIFFNSKELLHIEIDRTLQSFSQFIKYIMHDLNNTHEFEKEKEKNKPNFDKLEKLSKRYFEPNLFDKLDFKHSQISVLESLQFSLSEFENVSLYNQFELNKALVQGKVLYIKSDMLDETALKFLKLVIADIIQQSKKFKKETKCTVILDELSFYPTQVLSAGLSTVAGFGVKFILSYQSEAQLKDKDLRVAIKDNCQTKIYYKTSDDTTLKYIELLSGYELVSQITKNGSDTTIRQMQEANMNVTRLRALPRSRVAVLIEESSHKIYIFQTSPVPVKHPFDWSEINIKEIDINHFLLTKKFTIDLQDKQIDPFQASESSQPKELVL